jgi:hypothetical protein
MIKSDSLDNITLDSDEIRNIERFENNYYSHKKNILQNGGNKTNKLVKDIEKLNYYYLLSLQQNGGGNIKLTAQIKKRLDNKIAKLNN